MRIFNRLFLYEITTTLWIDINVLFWKEFTLLVVQFKIWRQYSKNNVIYTTSKDIELWDEYGFIDFHSLSVKRL